MSKIDVDAIENEIHKYKKEIENLEHNVRCLQGKLNYTFKCNGCGQYWDSMLLSYEYDRIYSWKSDYAKSYTVMSERVLAVKCPECGHEHSFRKAFNSRYETDTQPESERINIDEFLPNTFIRVFDLYNTMGKN